MPDLTLAEFVPLFLDRHAPAVRTGTIQGLRERLGYATAAFGDVPLRDLERMSGEIAAWRTRLPDRSRYAITGALRQGARRRRPVGTHGPEPGRARRAQPATVATRGARLQPRGDRRDRRGTAPLTPPSRCSPLRPACGQRNGRCLNAATSTAARACSP